MKQKYLLITLFLLIGSFGYAQESNITGQVTDENGDGLPGVNILVQGTTIGTVTDIDGNYTLKLSSDAKSLVFSFVGYLSEIINVDGRSTVNVALLPDIVSLSEVVVVGYGTQERATVTGAIATVDSEKINEVPVLTADQALQGRAAGVNVTNIGAPGTSPAITIRGLSTTGGNSPLVVVDGVITQGFGDVNPNDIETISVLKDASTTSIYGAFGANGVIVITTKSGASGRTKIELNSYAGIQRVTERFDLMNRAQYLQYAQNWGGAADGRLSDPQFADLIDNDTDWQDEIYQNGVMQSTNLAVSGGNENSNFRIGAGYTDQEGVLLNTGSSRYTIRANSNFNLGKFKIGETMSLSYTETNPENTSGGRSAIEHAIKMAPYFAVRNPNNIGGFQGPTTSLDGQDAENPVRVLTHPDISNKRYNFLGTLFASYEIIEGLTAKVSAGIDHWNFKNDSFVPSFVDGGAHSQNFAAISKGTGTHSQSLVYGSLEYTKRLGKHNVTGLFVAEQIKSFDTRAGASSTNSITDELQNLTNQETNIGSFDFEYAKIGYLLRANYDYDGKYIFAASIRQDESSRFIDNKANFYSVAGGWVISQENFFPQIDMLSNLKLRASYGTVGNDNIPNYAFASTISSGNFNYTFVGPNGEFLAAGSTSGTVGNPDLVWETTTMTNVGIDLGLLNDQITFSAEYFNNVSEDLLLSVPIAPSLANSQDRVIRNVGSIEVDGFEFNLGFNDFEGDFRWSANFNLSTTNNTVRRLGQQELVDGNFENGNILRSVEGESLFHFHGLTVDRIFQSEAEILTSPDQSGLGGATAPGDIKYLDISGPDGTPDGVIDDFDKTILGNPIPDVTLGLSLNAEYKGFDVNLFFNGMLGNEIYNTNIWDLEGVQRFFNASPRSLDAWTPENTDTDIPRLTSDPQNLVTSSRFVEDGSFVRLKNVTLGYTLPDAITKNIFSKLRVYLSAQNVFTITDYSGLDPEVGSSALVGGNSRQIGIDRGNYPIPKSFVGGIQMTF